jgi:hypothetical protein
MYSDANFNEIPSLFAKKKENGEIVRMYLSGWSMPFNNSGLMGNKLSNPDVRVITLPFLYLVLVPVIVLIYGLFAEKAISYLLHGRRTEYAAGSANTSPQSTYLLPGSARTFVVKCSDKMVSILIQFCGSCTRRCLLIACLVTAAIHLKVCASLKFSDAIFHASVVGDNIDFVPCSFVQS